MNKIFLILLLIIVGNASIKAQTATWSVPPTFEELEEYGISLYKIREKGKVGLADRTGKVLLDARYDSITPFYEHLALALEYEAGKYLLKGIIDDYNYDVVVPTSNYYVNLKYPMFYKGKLVVFNRNNKYGYLLPDGAEFLKCQYDAAGPFYEGVSYIKNGTRVEYLQEDGKPLNTRLESEGYIFLTGTHFNEKGEAFVQAKQVGAGMKYSIIDKNGNVIREAKISGKKIKNYEYRKNFEFSPLMEDGLHLDPVKIYEENGLYGFLSQDGSILLPAQFSEAYRFVNGYAKVKKDGKYGLLKLESGNFIGQFDKNTVQIRNGKCKSLEYSFTYPIAYADRTITLYVDNDGVNREEVALETLESGRKGYSFIPNFQNGEKEIIYHYTLLSENLLLWKDTQHLAVEYIKLYPPVLSIPQITEEFYVDEDGFVRADSDNKVDVYAVVENRSSEVLQIEVIWRVDQVTEVSQKLVIAPETSKRISTSIMNVKDRNAIEIQVKTSTGLEQKSTIKVKPFV